MTNLPAVRMLFVEPPAVNEFAVGESGNPLSCQSQISAK